VAHGYAQSGLPTAGGLEKNGSLTYLGLVTTFTGPSAQSPKAVLVYGLANSGESASLGLLDEAGRVTTVITTDPDGRLVSTRVPVEPALPGAALAGDLDEELRACNYSGACFDSEALCEANCPGGLAHPLAHCDVYINGTKVSTLIPG
jgi:hypothetical protein